MRYDQIYDREREKLIGDVDFVTDVQSGEGSARGERLASNSPRAMAPTDADEDSSSEDGMDELMIDLNRLYREQR